MDVTLQQVVAASYDGSRNALGMFDGEGKAVLASGSVYVGDWKEGKMEGVGKLIFKDGMLYEGAFKNNCITGHGVTHWTQGCKYEGEMENGVRNGSGTLTFRDSPTVYTGQWLDGLRHGKGTIWFDSEKQSFYEGDWHRDQKQGQGVMHYASGNVYTGSWHGDKRRGQGTMLWHTLQQQYTGQWEDNKPNGLGEHVWLKQVVDPAATTSHVQFTQYNRYHGFFSDGKRQGFGVMYYATGARFEGWWQQDLKHGPGTFVFEDGTVFVGRFVNDRPVLPPGAGFGPETSAVQVPLGELMEAEERPAATMAAVVGMLMCYNSELRSVYDKYSRAESLFLPADLERFSSSLMSCQFWELARDCRLVGHDLSLTQVDYILARSRSVDERVTKFRADQAEKSARTQVYGDGVTLAHFIASMGSELTPTHSPTAELLFREFCAALVRIAAIKYCHVEHLERRVQLLITRNVLPNALPDAAAQATPPEKGKPSSSFAAQYVNAATTKQLRAVETELLAEFRSIAQPNNAAQAAAAVDLGKSLQHQGEQHCWCETTPRAVVELLQKKGALTDVLTATVVAAACCYSCLNTGPEGALSSLPPAALDTQISFLLDMPMAYQDFVEALARCAELAMEAPNLAYKIKQWLVPVLVPTKSRPEATKGQRSAGKGQQEPAAVPSPARLSASSQPTTE